MVNSAEREQIPRRGKGNPTKRSQKGREGRNVGVKYWHVERRGARKCCAVRDHKIALLYRKGDLRTNMGIYS